MLAWLGFPIVFAMVDDITLGIVLVAIAGILIAVGITEFVGAGRIKGGSVAWEVGLLTLNGILTALSGLFLGWVVFWMVTDWGFETLLCLIAVVPFVASCAGMIALICVRRERV